MKTGGIGERIKLLRDQHEMSQEVFAKKLGVNRSTLSQIENGERKLYAEEIRKISDLLGVSTDILLGKQEEKKVIVETEKELPPAVPQKSQGSGQDKATIRISVPQKNLKKFKEVLLYLLKKVGAKPNVGQTVLYKLLYFIDFDYYELFEEQLTGARYQKNQYGPTPMEFTKITDEMMRHKELEKVSSKHFSYPQTKYLPLREPNLSILNANEIKLIDSVLDRLSEKNATEISDYSHGDVPWLTAEDQGIIDYEAVFYRTPQYSMRSRIEKTI